MELINPLGTSAIEAPPPFSSHISQRPFSLWLIGRATMEKEIQFRTPIKRFNAGLLYIQASQLFEPIDVFYPMRLYDELPKRIALPRRSLLGSRGQVLLLTGLGSVFSVGLVATTQQYSYS